jgi:pyoverdine/dityrosine biosynthesis protein Dit1
MSFQNLVRLSQIKKKSLPDYAQSVKKKMRKKLQLMSYDMMIGYDIYDCFTMEHFRLRQRMTLTIKM